MSKQELIKKICKENNFPEEFIIPTLSYFNSHKKIKPQLFSSFKERLKTAKKIKTKPKPINLEFDHKINVSYSYIKKTKEGSYIENDGTRNIFAAKNWRADEIISPNLSPNFHTGAGARVRMHIRGDGGITKTGHVFYSNTSKELLERFQNDFFHLLGKCKFNINNHKLGLSKTASRVFYEKMGYLRGFESQYDWGIDKDILEGNKKIKAAAIQAYFDDEGRFHSNSLEIVKSRDLSFLSKKKLQEVIKNPKKYAKYAPKLLIDLKKMIESFGIEVSEPFFYGGDLLLTVDHYGYFRLMAGWRLRICAEKNIALFNKEIGFFQKKRDKLVKNYLKNIKVHKAQRNKSWLLAIENCNKLLNENSEISVSNLLNISKRSITQVRRWIYDLKARGCLIEDKPQKIIQRDNNGRVISVSEKTYKLLI